MPSCGVCLSVRLSVRLLSVETSQRVFHTILVIPYQTLLQYSHWDPPLTGASNAGRVGKNRDSRPLSGFRIDDWWSVINNFDRGGIFSTKRGRTFIAQTVTYQ